MLGILDLPIELRCVIYSFITDDELLIRLKNVLPSVIFDIIPREIVRMSFVNVANIVLCEHMKSMTITVIDNADLVIVLSSIERLYKLKDITINLRSQWWARIDLISAMMKCSNLKINLTHEGKYHCIFKCLGKCIGISDTKFLRHIRDIDVRTLSLIGVNTITHKQVEDIRWFIALTPSLVSLAIKSCEQIEELTSIINYSNIVHMAVTRLTTVNKEVTYPHIRSLICLFQFEDKHIERLVDLVKIFPNLKKMELHNVDITKLKLPGIDITVRT